MQITASYTDKGAPQAKPLTGFTAVNLRNPVLGVHENDSADNISIADFNNTKYAILSGESGWLMFDKINLQFVTSVELIYGMQEPLQKGYLIEWYADRPGGTKLGETKIPAGGKPGFSSVKVPLQNTGDHPRKLYVLIRKSDSTETKTMAVSAMKFFAR